MARHKKARRKGLNKAIGRRTQFETDLRALRRVNKLVVRMSPHARNWLKQQLA